MEVRAFVFEAKIVAAEGAAVRRKALLNSKMVAFLAEGGRLTGESVEFVNASEAWLKVTRPIVGWCPIVRAGKIYLSIVQECCK